MKPFGIKQGLGWVCLLVAGLGAVGAEPVYDGTHRGKELLTPPSGRAAQLTGASIFGVRPGKPVRFCISATGEHPILFSAVDLPAGLVVEAATGWITGRAPNEAGDYSVMLKAENAHGTSARRLMLRVGETICLTPPMGWNSWYAHSEAVSEASIRDVAAAMKQKGLAAHGWTYVNIDDCWMGERNPESLAIQANEKFGDMKGLVDFVNGQGLKLGLYSTLWMSTYAGYMGGTAPNPAADYSAYYVDEKDRENPTQLFGRFPNGISKGLCRIGPHWLVDKDAQQFAEWGIDFVKYDWREWTLRPDKKGIYSVQRKKSLAKTEANTRHFFDDFRAVDRDIVLSLSPVHGRKEDAMVSNYCNLWRLTKDIHADWNRISAPFKMAARLQQTRPGVYADLDMLQLGPLGVPNRANTTFEPSPLTPAEQYFQVSLWCLLTQPLLLSCHVPTMDAFDLNLVTNDEVLAVNQDPLVRQGYRVDSVEGLFEIWAKDLVDGGKAVGLFNLQDTDQVITVTSDSLGLQGSVRDLWRQKEIGLLNEGFSAKVSAHGVVFIKITP